MNAHEAQAVIDTLTPDQKRHAAMVSMTWNGAEDEKLEPIFGKEIVAAARREIDIIMEALLHDFSDEQMDAFAELLG